MCSLLVHLHIAIWCTVHTRLNWSTFIYTVIADEEHLSTCGCHWNDLLLGLTWQPAGSAEARDGTQILWFESGQHSAFHLQRLLQHQRLLEKKHRLNSSETGTRYSYKHWPEFLSQLEVCYLLRILTEQELMVYCNILLCFFICRMKTNGAHSCIRSLVCLMTGLRTVPKRDLQWLWSSASSFNFQHPLFSLRSSSSCLPLLLRLSFTPSFFPSVMHFRRKFLSKMWSVQLAVLFMVWTLFLSFLNLKITTILSMCLYNGAVTISY